VVFLILNSVIIAGPAAYNDAAIRQELYVANFTQVAGNFHAPDGSVTPVPTADLTMPLGLGSGYVLAPVVYAPSNPPTGEVLVSWTPVLAAGVVTMNPVYGPAPVASTSPPAPTLAQLQQNAITELEGKIDAYAQTQYSNIKRTGIMMQVSGYTATDLENLNTFITETLALQASIATQINACADTTSLNAILASLQTQYAQYLTS